MHKALCVALERQQPSVNKGMASSKQEVSYVQVRSEITLLSHILDTSHDGLICHLSSIHSDQSGLEDSWKASLERRWHG